MDAGASLGTGAKGRQRIGIVNQAETETGGGRRVPVLTTTTTPFFPDETHDAIIIDAAAGAKIVNLPTIGAVPPTIEGRRYFIKKFDSVATTNTVMINAAAGENIDGAASLVLARQGQAVILVAEVVAGPVAGWRVLANTQADAAGAVFLTWGAATIAAAADSRAIAPGFDATTAPLFPATMYDSACPRAGVLRNLFARHNAAAGNGAAVTYTIYHNGVVTLLSVMLATGAVGQASNLVNAVAVAQGDRIQIVATKAANIAAGGVNVIVTAEFI
jgi:hypothetical protein